MTNRHLLDARETSFAVLKMVQKKETDLGRSVKYLRLSRSTLQNISNRVPLSDDFLGDVQSWLWHGGWILFKAGTVFGLAKAEAVENWPRSSSKLLADDLGKMKAGTYNFEEDEERVLELASHEPDGEGEELLKAPSTRRQKSSD